MNKSTNLQTLLIILAGLIFAYCLSSCSKVESEINAAEPEVIKIYKVTHGCGENLKVYYLKHGSFHHSESGYIQIYNTSDGGWDDTYLHGDIKVELSKEENTHD
jgi:hypothetical protein